MGNSSSSSLMHLEKDRVWRLWPSLKIRQVAKLYKRAGLEYSKTKYECAIQTCQHALKLLSQQEPSTSNDLSRAAFFAFKGKVYWRQSNLSLAMSSLQEAMEIYQRCYMNEISCVKTQKRLTIKLVKQPKADACVSDFVLTLQSVACIYCERGEYEKALSILETALEYAQKHCVAEKRIAKIHNNIAITLSRLHRKSESVDHYRKALKIKRKVCPRSSSIVTTLIGLSTDLPTTEAFKLLNEAKAIAEKQKQVEILVSAYGALGIQHCRVGNLSQARSYLAKAIGMEQSSAPYSLILADLYEHLATLHRREGKHKAATVAESHVRRIRKIQAPSRLQVKDHPAKHERKPVENSDATEIEV